MLAHILVVGHPVERQLLGGLIYQAQSAASLVHIVCTLTGKRILPETISTIIEGSHRHGQLLAQLLIVSHLGIAIEVSANAQLDVGTLIAQRILSVLAHQSALGIHTVERTLRTTKHIHTIQLPCVAVKGRLIHQGDIVHIDTHRRTVHTRANTSYIYRRGKAGTIVRHHERGHEVGDFAQVAHAQTTYLITRQYG